MGFMLSSVAGGVNRMDGRMDGCLARHVIGVALG